ncbi:MAG: hypothetical protein AAFS10_01585 [Myxococcota bacterium]
MKQRMVVHATERDTLDASQILHMWNLYKNYYTHVEKSQFIKDLDSYNYVLIGTEEPTGQFAGFMLVDLYVLDFEFDRVGIMYTGHTMFLPKYWGTKAVPTAMYKLAFSWKRKNRIKEMYWNLIAAGNRTYLAMCRNNYTYYPRYDRPTPARMDRLLRHVGTQYFGESYDAERGVIARDEPRAVFRSDQYAPFSDEVKALPEITFFLNRNPGYGKGDELSSLVKVSWHNVLYFALRSVYKLARRRLLSRRRAH